MKIGKFGIALIKEFEKCRLKAYPDGGGVWTIGWGHIKGVKEGDRCTQAQADAWLVEDCANAIAEVNKVVTVELNQQQFDALVSFEFNTGGLRYVNRQGQLVDSTLLKLLNAGDWLGAARQFTEWDHDNGKQVRGLTRRRLREQALFLSV